jgi:ribosomal protein S18 acetylase RimI-like enzyme
MSELVISVLRDRDTEAAVTALTLAMLNLPLHTAVFQGQDREARSQIEGMIEMLLRHAPGMVFTARLDGRIAGVLRMKSCRGRQSASPPQAGANELDLKETAGRVSHWQSVWTRHDPQEHHWHLGPVGVAPDLQGRGVGTALVQHFCELMDARGAAAYLETDQTRVVRFYERFGFQVIAEADILKVRNYFMWRPGVAKE